MVVIRGLLYLYLSATLSCKHEEVKNSKPTSGQFKTFRGLHRKLQSKTIELGLANKNKITDEDSIFENDEGRFNFDFYEFRSRNTNLSIEMEVTNNDNIMVPTIVIMDSEGLKYPLINKFFFVESKNGKKVLKTKWTTELTNKGRYFLVVASDNTEKEAIQSGVISYFSPVYFNFDKAYKTQPYGEYTLKLDVK
jgi:hypothetical protein